MKPFIDKLSRLDRKARGELYRAATGDNMIQNNDNETLILEGFHE